MSNVKYIFSPTIQLFCPLNNYCVYCNFSSFIWYIVFQIQWFRPTIWVIFYSLILSRYCTYDVPHRFAPNVFLGLCVSCRICPPLNNTLLGRLIPLMDVPMCTANNFPFMYSKKWYIQGSLLISTKHFPNRVGNVLSGIMIFCREGKY